jgi:hypothetical protein
VATKLSSMSMKLRREVYFAERNLNSVGEGLLPQMTNGFHIDLDIGDNLHHADSAVARHLEPNIPSRERVSGTNTLCGPRLNLAFQLLLELDEELQNVPLGDPRTSPLVAVPLEGTLESTVTASISRATPMEVTQPKYQKTWNKRKREGNFLDGRTELTSDELKEIRETYLHRQGVLRSEIEVKRRERAATLLFDRLLWAVPHDSKGFLIE